MQKKVKSRYIKRIAFSEIFILVFAIFAFGFMLAETQLTRAQGPKIVEYYESKWDAVYGLGDDDNVYWLNDDLSIKEGTMFSKDFLKVKGISLRGSTTVSKSSTQSGAKFSSELITIEDDKNIKKGVGKEKIDIKGGPKAAATEAAGYEADLPFGLGKVRGWTGSLIMGLTQGIIAYGMGKMIGGFFGASEKQTQAISEALGAGVFSYHASQGVFGAEKGVSLKLWEKSAWKSAGFYAGLIGVYVFLKNYKKEGEKTITFTCMPYEPQLGGSRCEECNENPFKPCSEYRCKALGQACQLLNKGTPGKEECAWVNPKDVTSPTITPWTNVLSPSELSYAPDTSIRPPALGVKIEKNDGCLEAFTPLQFGIKTNEPSQCKVDFNHTTKFDMMQYYFGESNLYEYDHMQKMRLPGPDEFTGGNSPIFQNDGMTQLFVRCRDANGNENVDEYSIKFCVDPSPDTTPPNIEGTSIISGNPVAFGTLNTSVEVYINEPTECKWSIESKAYEQMENAMSCATAPEEINALLSYTCIANLTGLKSGTDIENKFYFRCKDQPGKNESERNVMVQSYEYILRGSQPLNIIKVSPNGTVTGGTSAVTVDLELETANGAEEGKANCWFSPFGTNDSYVQMFESDSYLHKQSLQLTPGFYNYYFRCTDLGGNSEEASTNFTVFSDTAAPGVARVYRDAGTNALKIVTNEDAECVYSLTGCNYEFDEGLPASYVNPSIKTNSYVEWKPNTIYYMKCRDFYGNEPNPAECSIIVKPVASAKAV